MAKKSSGRLVSSAGLVNYYDSEDRRAIFIDPKMVIVVTALIGLIIVVFNLMY